MKKLVKKRCRICGKLFLSQTTNPLLKSANLGKNAPIKRRMNKAVTCSKRCSVINNKLNELTQRIKRDNKKNEVKI